MIKVYGCPDCGIMKIASMRNTLECPGCRKKMQRMELTFLEYSEMTQMERNTYLFKSFITN